MKTLSAPLLIEKNQLSSTAPWLILFDLILSESVTLRLVKNTEDITFDGHTYTAFPIEVDLGVEGSRGEIPDINVQFSNVSRVMQGYLEPINGGIGLEVVIRIVHVDNLTEDYADLETYVSINGTECTNQWVTMKLGLRSPLQRRFPILRYMANHCNWIFKGVECAYAGPAATCDRTFRNCGELGNTARFGGYQGLNLRGVKFA